VIPLFKTTLVLALAALLAASPNAGPLSGTFALQGGTEKTAGYLTIRESGGNPRDLHLDSWMTPQGSAPPIRAYDVDMTKMLHMIVVSDDFRTFLHVHPALQADGHFLLDLKLPSAARYYIYTDATPHGIGQQVFRFDLDGGPRSDATKDLSERKTVTQAGPYTVSLSTNIVSSSSEGHITVRIFEDGRPASDLHPYLGALAHAVFLNARDLSYVHVHPLPLGAKMDMDSMDMSSMDMKPLSASSFSSPNMMLHVELREPGTYKLWLQFRGGSQLYVAPFVVTAT
jgi:hypothetical protein